MQYSLESGVKPSYQSLASHLYQQARQHNWLPAGVAVAMILWVSLLVAGGNNQQITGGSAPTKTATPASYQSGTSMAVNPTSNPTLSNEVKQATKPSMTTSTSRTVTTKKTFTAAPNNSQSASAPTSTSTGTTTQPTMSGGNDGSGSSDDGDSTPVTSDPGDTGSSDGSGGVTVTTPVGGVTVDPTPVTDPIQDVIAPVTSAL